MKIAFITHYTNLYGANRSLLNLIDGLIINGIIPYVITPGEGDITKALAERGITFKSFPIKKWMSKQSKSEKILDNFQSYIKWRFSTVYRLLCNLYIVPFLIRQVRKWGIQLIYTNSSVIPIGAVVAKYTRLPHIWHLRELGELHYGHKYHYGRRIFKKFIKSADANIAVSESVRSHILDGLKGDRIKIIYNGVAWENDFNHYRRKAKVCPLVGALYTFAIIGLLHPNKGQEIGVRALAEVSNSFPNVRLLIAGDGNYLPIKRLSQKLGVEDKIEFKGFVHDPYSIYLRTDAVLVCSKYEAMGRVVAEAMSACRPVIGYAHSGTSELIEHEETGLLYHRNQVDLADCMKRFISNPSWAYEIGLNGWRQGRSRFSIETYSKNVYQVIRDVTKK